MAPTMDVRPLRPNTSNIDIMNAIRHSASPQYQHRIPNATKANVEQTVHNLINNRPSMNEFIDVLVNRIGLEIYKSISWTNPLSKFKRGMLEYGDTIEEVITGLLEAKRYDPDRDYLERDVFGVEKPEVDVSYHKVNRQDLYKLSINEPLLKRAFLRDGGLAGFITQLMASLNTSDEWDEFLLMTSLFETMYKADGFFKVNVPDIRDVDSDGPAARAALRAVRGMADTLPFLSPHYNAAGMPTFAKRDELELFLTPEANAALDVEALAGAFNEERANFSGRTTIIPQENLLIPGAQAILTTRDFFVVADQLMETRSINNPAGLNTNYFLHHWQVVSASRFEPAVLFTTEPGDVITITETPVVSVSFAVQDTDGDTVTTLSRGDNFQVVGDVVTNPDGGPNEAVIVTLVGAQSPRTYVTPQGVIHVSPDEPATSITVRVAAQDTDEPGAILVETAYGITGAKLVLWPNPQVFPDADNDGLLEVTPENLTKDEETDIVLIPTVPGVQYKKAGVNVANGSSHVITAPTAFTAVARSGHELAAGAPASWNFTA